MRYSDPAANRFAKTNLYYSTDPYIIYQDPTYLGFKLFFHFDQPDSGLLGSSDHPNTAISYLNRIGDVTRAGYMKKFIDHLKGLNQRTPWFFQAITGLSDAWKHGYSEDDFKAGLPGDRKIAIECLDESIDLRITALLDLYRKACFDWMNKREIVPKNLRYFKIKIYIYEARELNRFVDINQSILTENLLGLDPLNRGYFPLKDAAIEKAKSLNPFHKSINPNDFDYINDNISRLMFDFGHCEFLPDESSGMLDSISHSELAKKSQSITFSYKTVLEDNMFNIWSTDKKVSDYVSVLFDTLAMDNPRVLAGIDKDSFGIFGFANPAPGTLFRQTEKAQAIGLAKAKEKIGGLFLGNVFGFNASAIKNALKNPIQSVNAVANVVGSELLGAITAKPSRPNNYQDITASKSNDTKDVDRLGNIYE